MNNIETDSICARKADLLFISWYQRRKCLVIEVIGSITRHSLNTFKESLPSSVGGADICVILDLRQVCLLDKDGLMLLLATSKHIQSCEGCHAPIILVIPGEQPDRVLQLVGSYRFLKVTYGSVDDVADSVS